MARALQARRLRLYTRNGPRAPAPPAFQALRRASAHANVAGREPCFGVARPVVPPRVHVACACASAKRGPRVPHCLGTLQFAALEHRAPCNGANAPPNCTCSSLAAPAPSMWGLCGNRTCSRLRMASAGNGLSPSKKCIVHLCTEHWTYLLEGLVRQSWLGPPAAAGWAVGRSDGRLVRRTVGWSVGPLVGRSSRNHDGWVAKSHKLPLRGGHHNARPQDHERPERRSDICRNLKVWPTPSNCSPMVGHAGAKWVPSQTELGPSSTNFGTIGDRLDHTRTRFDQIWTQFDPLQARFNPNRQTWVRIRPCLSVIRPQCIETSRSMSLRSA